MFVVGLLARVVGAGALFWLVFPLWLSVFWGVQGYPPTLGDLARWYALGAFNAAPIVATVGVSILLTPLFAIRLSSILPPSLRFPPLREGNRELGQVPPLGEGNRELGQVPSLREGNRELGQVPPLGEGNRIGAGESPPREGNRVGSGGSPLCEGNCAPSVPPASRGNLKEGVKENRYANKEARGISRIGTPLVSALLYTLLVPQVAYALLLMYAEMWQYRAWDAMTPTLLRAYGFLGGAAFVVGWAVGWSMRPSRRRAPAGAVARRD